MKMWFGDEVNKRAATTIEPVNDGGQDKVEQAREARERLRKVKEMEAKFFQDNQVLNKKEHAKLLKEVK